MLKNCSKLTSIEDSNSKIDNVQYINNMLSGFSELISMDVSNLKINDNKFMNEFSMNALKETFYVFKNNESLFKHHIN